MGEELKAGREMDVRVAEQVMGWERRTLYDQVLDPGFFTGQSESMYRVAGQTDYLCRPGRFAESADPVLAREQVGELVIGGDQDLPRYSTEIGAAWAVADKLGPRFDGVYPQYDGKRLLHWVAVSTGENVSRRGHLGKTPAEAICRAALGLP